MNDASARRYPALPPFLDPITGGLLLDRIRILEASGSTSLLRGVMPGVFNVLHLNPGTHLDRFQGRGWLQDGCGWRRMSGCACGGGGGWWTPFKTG